MTSQAAHTLTEARVTGHDRLRAARERIDELLTATSADRAAWAEAMLEALDDLEAALQRHRTVSEAPGGTLDEAVNRKPGLMHAARRLRREHVRLLDDLTLVQEDVYNALETGTLDRERVRWRVGALQDDVRRHMGRGSDLLFEAFYRDDGVGD